MRLRPSMPGIIASAVMIPVALTCILLLPGHSHAQSINIDLGTWRNRRGGQD